MENRPDLNRHDLDELYTFIKEYSPTPGSTVEQSIPVTESMVPDKTHRRKPHNTMRHSKNGKSIRARSFEAFDRGERPVPFARANGFKLSTVYTYWHQYKQMRCISSKKVVTGEENAWNPTEAIVEILKLLAIHTGIPQNAVTDQFRASWEEIQQMVNMRVFDLAQLNRKRAAQILNETVALITVCWASGLPPEATLDILRR